MKFLIKITIAFLLLASCTDKASKDVVNKITDSMTVHLTEAQYKAANITLGKIEKRSIGSTIQVNGKLDVPPQNLISISAPLGGYVKSTKLLQGMKVRKGEVLATLENMEYIQLQQDYLDNRSKLEFLEAEYNRQVELSKENVNAVKTLQQSKSQYESTKANVGALEAKLLLINISPSSVADGTIRSSINLYSPIDAFVSQVHVNIGQFVSPTDVMFKLVNLDHIHAEVHVYEKDLPKISIGQKVTFHLTNEATLYPASVFLIGREIEADGTVQVHCHLDNENPKFLPGMFVTAQIEVKENESEVLPSGAIVNYEGDNFIFLSLENRFKAFPIKIGSSNNQYTEVIIDDSFDRNAPIVITGAFELMGLLKNNEEE